MKSIDKFYFIGDKLSILGMVSFLVKKSESKTFNEKISKLSIRTRQNIKAAENSFNKFCKENYDKRPSQDIFDELNTFKDDEQTTRIRDVIQDWIDWQYQQGSLTNSIKQYVSKIKRVFLHNNIKVRIDDFQEPLEYLPAVKEELHELTLDEIQKIFSVALPRRMGFYLALISTGARPGELLQVRKRDIDTTQKRIKIRIEAVNVKTRSGRSVWITSEAAKFLMIRLKELNDDDLVWGTNQNPAFSEKCEAQMFNKYTEEAGFTKRYKSNGFRLITLYSFRSYFFGKAADVHREGYAHKMTGHSGGGYLPMYDRMNDKKKLDWFLELESELIIDPTHRQELRIRELEGDNNIISDLKLRIEKLEAERRRNQELK